MHNVYKLYHFFFKTSGKIQKAGYIKKMLSIRATPWCNGSTSGFGPFRLGSSPGGVAIFIFRETISTTELLP